MDREGDIRKRLEALAKNDYAPPEGVSTAELTWEILPLLGSTDGMLREQYVYGTLHRWIVRRTLHSDAIVELAQALVDEEHLFLGIAAPNSDSIYMRSFSVLLLAPIVYAHRQDPFLSPSDLDRILMRTIEYLDRERDLRGYVSQETWWAHGVAHAADVLGQLAQCGELSAEPLHAMLGALARAALTETDVFIFEEDTRMASAAIEILRRTELDPTQIADWTAQLVPEARWTGELPRVHHRFLNARNVLRCLYFQGRKAELPDAIFGEIESALNALPDR